MGLKHGEFRRQYWGVERILFGVSPPDRKYLDKVFTGREKELEMAMLALYEAPRRVLVSGLFGIGKTIFLFELQSRMKSFYRDKILSVYESMQVGASDLSLTLLRGAARMLREEDEEAKRVDDALRNIESVSERKQEISGDAKLIKGGVTATTSLSVKKSISDPGYLFQRLVKRARERYPERRLVIFVDDLDKRDPATIRRYLQEARALLHTPGCSFVLTGHPLGILRDVYSTTGGVFDKQIKLPPFTTDELLEMIENYLRAGEVHGYHRNRLHPFTEDAALIIARKSFGIPRVLNTICFTILEEATLHRMKVVGEEELQVCWQHAHDGLKRGIQPDLRGLLEVLQDYPEGFAPEEASDDIFESLGVDSTPELIFKLEEAVKSDFAVAKGGRYFPHPRIQSLDQ